MVTYLLHWLESLGAIVIKLYNAKITIFVISWSVYPFQPFLTHSNKHSSFITKIRKLWTKMFFNIWYRVRIHNTSFFGVASKKLECFSLTSISSLPHSYTKFSQLKRFDCKQSARWQHLSRLKESAFLYDFFC